MQQAEKKRLVVGISGASGIPIAEALLRLLGGMEDVEAHLVVSRGALLALPSESSLSVDELAALADKTYDNCDISAAIASGTYKTLGMAVAPCSMKTVAGIASGYSENLLLRAADVTLKERRPLVLVPRECPLNQIHLRNLLTLAQMGVVILPPMLTFYNNPASVDDMVHHIACKVLDCFGLSAPGFRRWEGGAGHADV